MNAEHRRGFTLIEVLVVVAIIALLVAILLPALGRARAQTRSAVCTSNVKQMGVAMTLFSNEHGGRVPRGISRHGGGDPSGPINWVRMIVRMFGDKRNYAANFNRVPVEKHAIFSCPQRSLEYGSVFLDYVINSTDPRGPIQLSPCRSDPAGGTWYEVEGVTKIDKWEMPGDTIYITEAVEESWDIKEVNNSSLTLRGIRRNIGNIRRPAPPVDTGYDWFDVPGGKAMPTYRETAAPNVRMPRASLKMHLAAGSNAVFVDGHAQMVKPPPLTSKDPQPVLEFYLRKFGVNRRIVRGLTTLETTAALDPCTAGDTKWRP